MRIMCVCENPSLHPYLYPHLYPEFWNGSLRGKGK